MGRELCGACGYGITRHYVQGIDGALGGYRRRCSFDCAQQQERDRVEVLRFTQADVDALVERVVRAARWSALNGGEAHDIERAIREAAALSPEEK